MALISTLTRIIQTISYSFNIRGLITLQGQVMLKAITAIMLGILATNASAQDISFGIVPQQSAKKLASKWGPIFKYLNEKTGHQITFATAKDIPSFELRLRDGQYDMAYMNPYHFTVFNQKPGYTAFAKQKNKQIKGIIVVPKTSPIQELSELNGKVLAFPSPAAFAASVLPRARLELDGIKVTPSYVSSHDSVYIGVSKGFFVAGGGVYRTLGNAAPDITEQLRVLWETPGYTPHAFAANPNLDKSVVNDIQQAMLEMNTDPEGQKLLKSINFKGMAPAQDAEWDDVRALNIKLLQPLLSKE